MLTFFYTPPTSPLYLKIVFLKKSIGITVEANKIITNNSVMVKPDVLNNVPP